MKKIFTFFLLITATSPVAFSQLKLTAGDRCTCPFGPTNFFLFGGGPGPFQPVFGEVLIRLYDASLPAGTVLRYEMFENNATEQPICAGFMTDTNSNPSVAGCDVDNACGDLQGTVRLTLVSGSVTLHSVSLQVGRFSNGQYQRWQGGLPMQSIVIDPRAERNRLAAAIPPLRSIEGRTRWRGFGTIVVSS